MTIIRIEHNSDYTCISNKTIRDNRLSYKARGLHHLLLSYPNNWTVNIDHLVAASDKDGRAAVMSALNELQEHGYMTMRRIRNEQTGQFIGWEKVIRETPIPQDEAIPTESRKSNVGNKARKSKVTAEARKSDLGETKVRKSNVGTEVRKTALRFSHKTDKPLDGKSDCIISTNQNKYLNQEVSITPLPPSKKMPAFGEQLELCFSEWETNSIHPLASQSEQSKLPGKETTISCFDQSFAPRLMREDSFTSKPSSIQPVVKRSQQSKRLGKETSNSCFDKSFVPQAAFENSASPEPVQTLLPPVEIAVATDGVENLAAEDFLSAIEPFETTAAAVILPSSTQASDRHREFSCHRRFTRNQPQYPKNIDGSDRLPWETDRRGKFNPEFEQHMARSLGNYPAYKDLLPGELLVKVRKHICAAKYDLKRQDELEIEWEAMHSTPQMPDGVSNAEVGAAKTYAHFAHLFGVSS